MPANSHHDEGRIERARQLGERIRRVAIEDARAPRDVRICKLLHLSGEPRGNRFTSLRREVGRHEGQLPRRRIDGRRLDDGHGEDASRHAGGELAGRTQHAPRIGATHSNDHWTGAKVGGGN